MKKGLSVLFVVLAVMATFVSTAFAAPVSGKSVSLVSVEYNKGGVVLLFETSGLTEADLKDATLFANSNYQNIYCTFVNDTTTVRCTAAKSLADDGEFKVTLAGFTFWGELPKERDLQACSAGEVPWYKFNFYIDGEFVDSWEWPAHIWDWIEDNGWFNEWKTEFGETFEITGKFCSSDWKKGHPG